MNTYRFIEMIHFPQLRPNEETSTVVNLIIPGFTENAKTKLRCISQDYYGFEFYEIEHQILIKDTGIAYGFLEGEAVKLEFHDYIKSFTVKTYVNRSENFLLFSQSSFVVKDLFNRLKKNNDTDTELKAYELNLDGIGPISRRLPFCLDERC